LILFLGQLGDGLPHSRCKKFSVSQKQINQPTNTQTRARRRPLSVVISLREMIPLAERADYTSAAQNVHYRRVPMALPVCFVIEGLHEMLELSDPTLEVVWAAEFGLFPFQRGRSLVGLPVKSQCPEGTR
jgi:hypothetical protein